MTINPRLPFIAVGLGWDAVPMRNARNEVVNIDLDASCLAFDAFGASIEDETVFFGRLRSRDGAILHSGGSIRFCFVLFCFVLESYRKTDTFYH